MATLLDWHTSLHNMGIILDALDSVIALREVDGWSNWMVSCLKPPKRFAHLSPLVELLSACLEKR